MLEFEFFTNQIAKVRPWHVHLSRDSAEDSVNQLSPGRISDLKKLAPCTRYIDDLWNPLMRKAKFQAIVKQIYPVAATRS
jgi:hypothetical protein